MTNLSMRQAQVSARQLHADLQRIVDRDPEQEVRGIALPVVDACLSAYRTIAEDNPVLSSVQDAVSVALIADEEPIRAVDVLVAVGQVVAVIGDPAPRIGIG